MPTRPLQIRPTESMRQTTVSSLRAPRYDTGQPIHLALADGRITGIEPAWPDEPVAEWPVVAPGLFDIQINGYGGIMCSDRDLTADAASKAVKGYLAHGVTRLFPTLITSSFETLK